MFGNKAHRAAALERLLDRNPGNRAWYASAPEVERAEFRNRAARLYPRTRLRTRLHRWLCSVAPWTRPKAQWRRSA